MILEFSIILINTLNTWYYWYKETIKISIDWKISNYLIHVVDKIRPDRHN